MGHQITAVIGDAETIARVADAAGCPPPIELARGLVIAPLGHAQLDALMEPERGAESDGFTYLCAGIETSLSSYVGDGMLAYVETEYFGGTGGQAAAVFSRGKTVLRQTKLDQEPASREDPINKALRMLGVQASTEQDEFDTVGLGRFRDLEDLGLDQWGDDDG